MTDIANMTERIVIQRLSSTTDGRGNPLEVWETVYSCRAEIGTTNNTDIYVRHDNKARSYGYDDPEFYAARQELHEIKLKVTIRYTKKLVDMFKHTTLYRLIWDDNEYNVLSATNRRDKKQAKNEKIVIVAVCKDGNNTITGTEQGTTAGAATTEGGENDG